MAWFVHTFLLQTLSPLAEVAEPVCNTIQNIASKLHKASSKQLCFRALFCKLKYVNTLAVSFKFKDNLHCTLKSEIRQNKAY